MCRQVPTFTACRGGVSKGAARQGDDNGDDRDGSSSTRTAVSRSVVMSSRDRACASVRLSLSASFLCSSRGFVMSLGSLLPLRFLIIACRRITSWKSALFAFFV